MTAGEAARAARLFDEGARILEAQWDDEAAMVGAETPHGTVHAPRGTLAYAGVLLRRGGRDDVARAERAIRAALAIQERREDDAHYGNFKWYAEHEGVTDLNAVEFILDGLNHLVREFDGVLSTAMKDEVREAIALGLGEIDRLDVHPSYTNIALSDIANSVLGGEAIGEEAYVERGRRRLDEWLEFTNRSGAPHEFNSPTYAAVDLGRLAALADGTADPGIALKARVAEERVWMHVASHYHPGLAQLAGPHARSYRDGWTGAPGYLKLMLWRLLGDDNLRRETPFFPGGREEGHGGAGGAAFRVPDYALDWMREKRFPFETLETADAAGGMDLSTYMTESYALGTASRTYSVGEPPEHSMQFNSTLLYFRRDTEPGYGALYARYVIDDRAPATAFTTEEHQDDGRFVGAQHRARVIVAYGLRPRARPVRSYKLSVRMLGASPDTEVWVGSRRVSEYPALVEPGDAVVVAEGDVYVAIVPLEPTDIGSGAPVELRMEDGQLVLDIYNYRGPAKNFWEYASLGGAFYHGNVRNAFALEVAERRDFGDVDAFRQHIAAARLADSVDEGYVREIVYASEGGSVSLRYSLWDMSPLARRFDGATYTPPMARAGALDVGGMQWVQSRDSLVELPGATLLAGTTPKWLVSDPERGRFAFVNPSDEAAPLWLETLQTVVECDAFGFGRVALDERASSVAIEATDDIGPVRIRADGDLRLTINGVDVSGSLTPPDAAGVREFGGL